MNIAICDDDLAICSQLENLVGDGIDKKVIDTNCEVFSSGDSLLKYLKTNQERFHLYLLDIEMEGADGLEVASWIRREDDEAIIIFITNHAELMPEAFRVLAFQYVVKPLNLEKTEAILLAAIDLLQRRKTLFHYRANKQSYTLKLSEIEYIESVGRKIILHLLSGECREYYGTLKEAFEKVEGLLFARAHSSYVVNLEQIETFENKSVLMRSGSRINIGKKYHPSIHAAYRRFVLMRAR